MIIKLKIEGLEKALEHCSPTVIIKATNSAINDVSKQGLNEAERLIRTEYNIKPARLKQFLKLTVKAVGNSMEAIITGRGRGLALSYFDAKQTGVMIKNVRIGAKKFKTVLMKRGRIFGGQVTALVKLTEGRKVVSGEYGNKPFIAQTKSGHIGVWVRKGKERTPIEQLYRAGVGWLFGTKHIMDGTKKVINEKFSSRFSYWLNRYKGESR